ncbi:ATPase involved in DNA replication initiation [Lutibaculum baratangense AMV1]|uniref:ATPase involved in DNA replication initiation n=1 Tax=Lutibaculum baratangense AMV1 TaxID=631454 RepID=V4QSK6_9HYPH|nr:ATPase involved in DNA replication initiation [Lutibaculum baratangense AMV1]
MARLVERYVARHHGVALSEMMAPGRATARAKWARHTTMYLERVVLQLTCEEIAARFGHHRTSVTHACRKVEERRDEAAFDARLQALEARVGRYLEASR